MSHRAVADKANEIVAILASLDVAGAVVTVDAMGCQKSIARRIRQRGEDEVLSLTNLQPTRHESVTHHGAVSSDGDATDLLPARYQTVSNEYWRIGEPRIDGLAKTEIRSLRTRA